MRVYTSKIVQCIAAGTLVILSVLVSYSPVINADTAPLAMLDPNLEVTPVLSAGISQPIGIVFLSLNDYLVLSAILFAIGTAGVFVRRNLITILLSIEIMLNAVNLSFVAFGRAFGRAD